ncbi:FeoA family protein [Desulfofalx alkaliphila]|uniref:FeoA family protein n=1 Tax=Desulfofalx alkaliphila TaxID=105483 RepID=UPI0004E17283|nr:FeoA family protein [Desulfofalx alkaliphila]
MLLYALKKAHRCVIEKTPPFAILNSLGLREGITVTVKSKQPLGGPIVVELGNRSIAVAKDVAEKIIVKEVV